MSDWNPMEWGIAACLFLLVLAAVIKIIQGVLERRHTSSGRYGDYGVTNLKPGGREELAEKQRVIEGRQDRLRGGGR